jgi:hypothetical protein
MITEPRSGNVSHQQKECPICGQIENIDAIFCRKCGTVFESMGYPDSTDEITHEYRPDAPQPRQRPSLAQQCPGCGDVNRPGVILCETCGTNLQTGERPPISTRVINVNDDLLSIPIDGTDTLDVGEYRKSNLVGTSIFSSDMILRIQIEDGGVPILLRLAQSHHVIFGRSDGASSTIDVDLTPYAGYSNGISRRHAAIALEGERLELWDLDSSNGTYLNGTRLEPRRRHQLRDSDEIRMGKLVLCVYFEQRVRR